jgi:hypothetical protein
MNFIDLTIYYAVHTTVYVYLLLFIKLILSKINAIKLLTSLLLKLWKVIITQEGIYSLYNFVTDNFKEYDIDTEYCVCESRDMSDGRCMCLYHSFKIKNYFIHLELASCGTVALMVLGQFSDVCGP